MFAHLTDSNFTIHTWVQAMEGVRTFLESSTIHGLTYISTTRKYARIFWILVVIAGFLGASLLIKESFDSWSESPIKTTVETLPISEITFPKVTVCPPKNTFTDLNYDLMMTENVTLTKEMTDEMFKYAVDVINEDSFSENDLTKLHEKDRFYNWYHGYTDITSPFYDIFGLTIVISTSATSGVVNTQHYGEKFRPELEERKLYYKVYVYPPDSVKNNENVTLHFKVEKISLSGLASGSKDIVYIHYTTDLEADQTTAFTNFTPPVRYRVMRLHRDVSSEDVETQRLDFMPGFRFSWWYSGAEVTPDKKYKDEDLTKQFFR